MIIRSKNRKDLLQKALCEALAVRGRAGVGLTEPICIFDFVENQGVEVRFLDVGSMEGMYCRQPGPLIIVSSERPYGRKCYTCAHEYGHHVFGHGSTVDQLITGHAAVGRFDPNEFLVETFAGFLLMPQVAVQHSLGRRGWRPAALTPLQVYALSCNFGVGYSTLIHHMSRSLRILSGDQARELLRVQPAAIRKSLLGRPVSSNVVLVDTHWGGRPVDVAVGDFVVFRDGLNVDAGELRYAGDLVEGRLFEATSPGIGRVASITNGWASFVRVSRPSYVGRSRYRHLEEVV